MALILVGDEAALPPVLAYVVGFRLALVRTAGFVRPADVLGDIRVAGLALGGADLVERMRKLGIELLVTLHGFFVPASTRFEARVP